MMQLDLLAPTLAQVPNTPPVTYYQGWMGKAMADELLNTSLDLDWLHNNWSMMGQSGKLPRKEAIFGDDRYTYSYSRGKVRLTAKPWPSELETLKNTISCLTGYRFQLVIGNLYEGGHHHIGWHDDGRPELGERPAIASLSVGASRRFCLRKKESGSEIFNYTLNHGDLLVMHPGCQEGWLHQLPKTSRQVDIRVNWTFRPWRETA